MRIANSYTGTSIPATWLKAARNLCRRLAWPALRVSASSSGSGVLHYSRFYARVGGGSQSDLSQHTRTKKESFRTKCCSDMWARLVAFVAFEMRPCLSFFAGLPAADVRRVSNRHYKSFSP